MKSWAWAASALAAAVVWVCPARGEVASLGASRDNTLYSSTTGGRSNGAGDYFFAGVTAQGGIRRGLVAFDVSSIPADATINSATLVLHLSRTIALAEPVNAHRVLADWGEGTSNANNEEGRGAPSQPGDATWLHTFYNTNFWSNPGGDFDPVASASTTVEYEGFFSWNSPQLAADVQAWVDGTLDNFGWLLMCNESYQTTAKRFDTKENPVADYRPALVIDYTPIPEPALGVWCIVAAAFMAMRRQRNNAV